MTLQTQLVLRAFLSEPNQKRYGLELCGLVGLHSGTIYPILARLEHVGWLDSGWEDVAEVTDGRPRRRFYWLTRDGAERARDALARTRLVSVPTRVGWMVPQPGGGGVST
jgi:DNA-binding PadR family transcriptional regulator